MQAEMSACKHIRPIHVVGGMLLHVCRPAWLGVPVDVTGDRHLLPVSYLPASPEDALDDQL